MPADQARGAGMEDAAEGALARVYDQLRAIAHRQMAAEHPGHTLTATALVHEVYLRLAGEREIASDGRAHFYHLAAEAMRRLLVDHARVRGRIKRGGNRARVPLSVVDLAEEHDEGEVLALDDAVRTAAPTAAAPATAPHSPPAA